MSIVDASVLVAALLEPTDVGRRARGALSACGTMQAPDVIDAECMSALRRLARTHRLTEAQCQLFLHRLRESKIERLPSRHLIGRAWKFRHNASAYDALYIAAAELLDQPLFTADGGLAAAAVKSCTVTFVDLHVD
jgi:predicted nucleic acid-binding protein